MSTTRKKKTAPKKSTPKKRGAGEWKPIFLASLATSGNVRLSCEKAGIARRIAYTWKEKDEEFARQWDEAIDEAVDILEAIATQRARTTSDTLLIFLLKAHRPEKYRERWQGEITGIGGGPVSIQIYIPDNGRD